MFYNTLLACQELSSHPNSPRFYSHQKFILCMTFNVYTRLPVRAISHVGIYIRHFPYSRKNMPLISGFRRIKKYRKLDDGAKGLRRVFSEAFVSTICSMAESLGGRNAKPMYYEYINGMVSKGFIWWCEKNVWRWG